MLLECLFNARIICEHSHNVYTFSLMFALFLLPDCKQCYPIVAQTYKISSTSGKEGNEFDCLFTILCFNWGIRRQRIIIKKESTVEEQFVVGLEERRRV